MSSILNCIDSQCIKSISVEIVEASIDAGVRSDGVVTTMLSDYWNKNWDKDTIEKVNINTNQLKKKLQIHCKFDLGGQVAKVVFYNKTTFAPMKDFISIFLSFQSNEVMKWFNHQWSDTTNKAPVIISRLGRKSKRVGMSNFQC